MKALGSSVRQHSTIVSMLITVLLVISFGLSVLSQQDMAYKSKSLFDDANFFSHLHLITTDVQQLENSVREVVILQQPEQCVALRDQFTRITDLFVQLEHHLTPQDYQHINATYTEFKTTLHAVLNLVEANQSLEAAGQLRELTHNTNLLHEEIKQFELRFQEEMLTDLHTLSTSSSQTALFTGLLGFFVLLLSLYGTFSVIVSLRPLEGILQTLDAMGHGVLTQKAVVYRNDEIGQIAFSINRTIDQLTVLEEEKAIFKAALITEKEKAERATRAKSDFLANMTHELRTPMGGVLGLIELMLDGELVDDQREHAETALESGHALLRIINDILDMSKIEAGQLEIQPTPFDFISMANRTVELFKQKATTKGLDLRVNTTHPEFWLSGDPIRLRQILVNLLGNAIKFTEAGHVTLAVVLDPLDNKEVKLTLKVSDTGIGMDEGQQRSIFRRFQQADESTTRRFGGTGLGLSITKQLIELMQGELQLYSAIGQGSTFWFELTLPVAEAPPKKKPSKAHLKQFNLRVLVVEDNRVNQMVAKRTLEQMGITVVTAENGELGVEQVQSGQFDLVFMDCHMPVMDGLQATKHIRSLGTFNTLPIIALTANAMKGEREKCLAVGMNDFLTKPINRNQLIACLTRWSQEKTNA